MSSVCAAIVGASLVLTQAPAPESNHDHLKEFGDAFAGDWLGAFEFDVDVPGVVKKGDKVVVRSSTKWILNKTALEVDWEADINGKPAGCGKALIGWDRSAEEIVTFGVGSFGGCARSTYHKVGGRWIQAHVGAGVDGRRNAGQNVITFSEDGNTQVVEITGRISHTGEVLPNFSVSYKRVKSSE